MDAKEANLSRDPQNIRQEIDSIDARIVDLLNRRACLSVEIGNAKRAAGLDTFNPAREQDVLDHVGKLTEPPLTPDMTQAIFNLIFSISRSLQETKKIAYLGPEGTYSFQAASSVFSHDSELHPQESIEDIITEVINGRADLGVVPVENSTEGMVNRTLDMMASSGLYVCREIMLPIRHCLASMSPSLDAIQTIYSHSQPLAQCREWLRKNTPQAATQETSSTSKAAIIAKEQPDTAAIASIQAAQLYGLNVLAKNINDCPDNITRFWVISRRMSGVEGKAKSSIIVNLENRPGALFDAIGAFASQGINLTKIESRPSRKGPWEYMFFIDFQGCLEDENVKHALEELKKFTTDIIALGSYPEGSHAQ